MADRESNNNGGVGSKGKPASIFPAKKKSVTGMAGKKVAEIVSGPCKTKKIEPRGDGDDSASN